MAEMSAAAKCLLSGFAWAVALAVIAFGLYFQFQYSINADNAALLEFARRLLTGGASGIDFYDPNPPLSVLIYVPAVLLAQITGLAAWHSLTLYVLALSILAAALSWAILRRFDFLEKGEASLITAIFLIGSVFISNIFFAERDHIIAIGLFPLLLAQFAINKDYKIPGAILYPALILGALAVLIKPHYGLMPVLMIAHRALHEKSLKSVFKADFMVLAIATLAYATICLIFFRDFVINQLPDAMRFYAQLSSPEALKTLLIPAATTAALLLAATFLCPRGPKRDFILMLDVAALCLIIAFAAQLKGFYYHLIPAILFLALSATALTSHLAKNYRPILIAWLPLLLLVLTPVRPAYPTHAEYKTLPLAKILSGCDQPCSFLIVNDHAYMAYETALYTNSLHASRFISLWFEPMLACGTAAPEDLDRLYAKYAAMVTEDLERYKPSILLITKAPDTCPDGSTLPFDFGQFFGNYPAFAAEWQNYRFDQQIEFDRALYFAGTSADKSHMMNFDIYRRK
jgi:hypothetical protein